jgi:hypothetical protein
MMQIVSIDLSLVRDAVVALSAPIQETDPDQQLVVVDTWRELVASLNDTHVLHPDDPGRRPALCMQDFVAIDASLV